MKYAQVSYFYPTSPLAKKLKMPNGGYCMEVVKADHLTPVREPKAEGFDKLEDAFQHVRACNLTYGRYSLTPQLPASCEALEAVRSTRKLEPCSGCGQIHLVSANGLCPDCKL